MFHMILFELAFTISDNGFSHALVMLGCILKAHQDTK
jgi:hypothetical protein